VCLTIGAESKAFSRSVIFVKPGICKSEVLSNHETRRVKKWEKIWGRRIFGGLGKIPCFPAARAGVNKHVFGNVAREKTLRDRSNRKILGASIRIRDWGRRL